nr:uncharacterized protein LOC127292756 isoform X3 [Lolium perenne]
MKYHWVEFVRTCHKMITEADRRGGPGGRRCSWGSSTAGRWGAKDFQRNSWEAAEEDPQEVLPADDLSPTATNGTPASMHDPSPTPTNGSKRRPRKLTSKIWKDAEPIYVGGLLMQGRCKYCNNVFPASKVSGTSQLGRHLKVCEVKDSMDGVIKQIKTSDEIDPDWKFDQEAARIELVNLVVLHVLPFTFVEYAGFRKFCASLNPWFKSVNRVTIQNDCMEAYRQFRDQYETSFKNFNHRVSLTGDMWTAMEVLFTEYTAEFEENMEILSQEGSGEEVALADTSLSDWQAHIKLKVARCRNELQQYVEEGFHPCTPDFNILKWWDVNSERYPILGNMARDVLAVPASTVASESAFSACGRVITDHRSSLAPETVEALMCYGDWIRSRKPTNAGQENRCEEQRVVDHLVCGT